MRSVPTAAFLLLVTWRLVAHADADRDQSAAHETEGRAAIKEGNWRLALDHLQSAHELAPKNDYLIMMGHCEYNLGLIKPAREHYRQFLNNEKSGPLADAARVRLKAIERRPATFVISANPPDANVRIEGPTTLTARGRNEFEVQSGRYRIVVSKPNYKTETLDASVDVGDTKPLFIQLAPIPARLEIRTQPGNATLYVRGNRAQNPYLQQVEPGTYEIYAEATDHASRRDVVNLVPGQRLTLDFALPYVQRSGRPELIGFWTAVGAVAGSTLVLTRLESVGDSAAAGTLVLAGAVAGGIGGAVAATVTAPDYIPDNRAIFRIGAMGLGAVEGATIGLAAGRLSRTWGWVGGAAGLGTGVAVGTWLDHKAPTYGRVALIQSAAAVGALGGVLAVPAFRTSPADSDYPIGMLVGVNVGLAAGLAMAYLPDQRVYGPSWQRVILVDLAGAFGLFAGALVPTLDNCLVEKSPDSCRFDWQSQFTARYALAGATLGLAAGWILTRNYDHSPAANPRTTPPVAVPTAIAVQSPDGTTRVVPGLAAQGRF